MGKNSPLINDIFSLYHVIWFRELFPILVLRIISHFGFENGILVLIVVVPGHFLPFTLMMVGTIYFCGVVFEPNLYFKLSLVMRNPDFCICENKDSDQLRGNREADQRLCFRYKDTLIPLLSKSEISSL